MLDDFAPGRSQYLGVGPIFGTPVGDGTRREARSNSAALAALGPRASEASSIGLQEDLASWGAVVILRTSGVFVKGGP